MGTDSALIRKMFCGLLITNTVSMALNILCMVIDSIVTGRFLGPDAVTASGLAQPVFFLVNTIGMLVGPGLGIIITRYMGKAETDRINQAFSIVMYASLTVGIFLTIVIYAASSPLAAAMGHKAGPEVVKMTSDYLKGFSLGMVPLRLSMSMMAVMMIDNDKMRAVGGTAVTLVSDVSFDLLNVLVFHGGMYGMAVASSCSYLLSALFLFTHFTKKNRILHFTLRDLHFSDLKDSALLGIPNMIGMFGQTLRGFAFNAVLLAVSGGRAVAALSVCNSSFSVFMSILLGLFITTATLSSMLYSEEDRNGLAQMLGISLKTVYIAIIAAMGLTAVFARPLASLFLKSDSSNAAAILDLAVVFIRYNALQLILFAGSFSISGVYQGTHKLGLNYLISLLRDCILPVGASCLLGMSFGLAGFEAGFVVSGVLVLLICYVIPSVKNKRISYKPEDLLLLDDEFGARPEEKYEITLHSVEEVMEASEQVMEFCRGRGADDKTAFRYSLFVEEIASNTFDHGFRDISNGSLDLRMVYNSDKQIIRFRDNGRQFDPTEWLKKNHPDDPLKGAGIRIVTGMAEEVRYIPAMGLNNLLVIVSH